MNKTIAGSRHATMVIEARHLACTKEYPESQTEPNSKRIPVPNMAPETRRPFSITAAGICGLGSPSWERTPYAATSHPTATNIRERFAALDADNEPSFL